MRKVFTDFHHSSLLRSTAMLFEERLGIETYRPIGMEWFDEGYWKINDQHDTAQQFLGMDQLYVPEDGTPPLNIKLEQEAEPGVHYCADPGLMTIHRACTLEYFKNNEFDFVIASIPAHVPIFKRLIAQFQPKAKLIVQMGNNWPVGRYNKMNILASTKPFASPDNNVKFYHQEFDTQVFGTTKTKLTKKIYSFVNLLPMIDEGSAWHDFMALRDELPEYSFASFGGQCPSGNMNGPKQLADKMREAQIIFHVKPGGDGFGHIIHNAYCVGRPIITRASHYQDQLAGDLMVEGTFFDLDQFDPAKLAETIANLGEDYFEQMGYRAALRFREVVDYNREAREIWHWLETLY